MGPGDVLDGRYRLEGELGRGGMAVVWRATDLRLERAVAVKTIAPHLSGDPAFRERFRREARAAARVVHPNVVALHDHAESPELAYAVLQLVDGPDLRHVLLDGPLPVDDALAVLTDVAAALDAAAAQGLLHRDVKPRNVLLDPSAGRTRALLADFGLATTETATQTGPLLGSEGYVAPERMLGLPATRASDTWSLARVLVDCLTGVERGRTGRGLAALPPGAAAEVERALSPEPAHRPASAGALAAQVVEAVRRAGVTGAALGDDTGRVPAGDTVRVPAGDAVRVPAHATAVLPVVATGAPAGGASEQPPGGPPRVVPRVPAARPAPASSGARALLPVAVVLLALLGGLAVGWQRAVPAATPAAVSAPPSPEERLRALLPPEVYGACRPRPEGVDAERPASLTCTPATPGADELLVTLWRDPAAMRRDWEEQYVAGSRYEAAPCGGYEPVPGTFRRSTWGDGLPLACYLNRNGDSVVMWEYPDQALQVRAVRFGDAYSSLFTWWQAASDVPLR